MILGMGLRWRASDPATRDPSQVRQREDREGGQRDLGREEPPSVTGFDDGGRGRESGCVGPARSLKR